MGIDQLGQGEYFLDVRVKRNGHELRKRETFRGSRSAAEDRYFEIKRELRDGAAASLQPAQTFAQVLVRYKDSRGGIPRSQLPIYNALMEDLGAVSMTVFPDKVSQYANILRKLPSKRSGKRLSNATLNRYRAMIFAALNLAVELGTLEKNPVSNAHFAKFRETPRDRILTPYEIQALLNVIDQEAPHLGPLVRFSLAMPSRKSELVNARREWLDLVNGVIRIPGKMAKGGRGSVKIIPPDLVTYFRTLPADCPFLFYKCVAGQYRRLGDFKKSWGRCLRLAGIEDFRLHDLRHVACTQLLAAGSTLKAVQDVGGWTSSKMVDRYHSFIGQNVRDGIKFSPGNALPSGHQVDTSREDGRENGESVGKTANL